MDNGTWSRCKESEELDSMQVRKSTFDRELEQLCIRITGFNAMIKFMNTPAVAKSLASSCFIKQIDSPLLRIYLQELSEQGMVTFLPEDS